MKNILILISVMFLQSCDNSPKSAANNSERPFYNSCVLPSSPDNIEKNSLIVHILNINTGLPMSNIIVQLGNVATNHNILLSDFEGTVHFKNLSQQPQQFHVFGPQGYNWVSYYQIDASNGCEIITNLFDPSGSRPLSRTTNSHAKISGSINNINADSNIEFAFFSDQFELATQFAANQKPISQYEFNVNFNQAASLNVNAEMWALEYQVDPLSSDVSLADLAFVPKFNFSTNTILNTTVTTMQNIQFKPESERHQKPLVAQFDLFEWPNDLEFFSLKLNTSIRSQNKWPSRLMPINLYTVTENNFIATPSFHAYLAPNFSLKNSSILLQAKGINNKNIIWTYSKQFKFGQTNIKVKPRVTEIPMLPETQSDATISWTASSNSLLYQKFAIRNLPNTPYTNWKITIFDSSTQITLPTPPNEVTSILTIDTQYYLALLVNYVYSESHNAENQVTEQYNNIVIWTR